MLQVPPRDSKVWKTPMFEQYFRIKEGAEDCLLFYRMGDFFELFGTDAVLAAPVLEIQLTARDKEADIPVPMCGIPAHSWESYAEKLLKAGHKIALCEQLSDPKAPPPAGTKGPKLVERGIVRILTPGLPINPQKLDDKAPHYLVSVAVKKTGGIKIYELEVLDYLAGELFEGEVEGKENLFSLFDRIRPKEILVASALLRDFSADSPYLKILTTWIESSAKENLLAYLSHTQRRDLSEIIKSLPEARDLKSISGERAPGYARLPQSVLEQWAVLPELFELLDGCGSSVGSRKLRSLLGSPLSDVARIERRQKLLESIDRVPEIYEHAKEVYDFERILGRFRIGAAQPKELLRLFSSLKKVQEVMTLSPVESPLWMETLWREGLEDYFQSKKEVAALLRDLESALNLEADPLRLVRQSDLIKEGFDEALDYLRKLNDHAETWLLDYEEKLRLETGISTLKIRYNRVFGYYIEVTKGNLNKVPDGFDRKQTTVQGERFTTAELRGKETEILSAGLKLESRSKEILEELQNSVLALDLRLRIYVQYFAWVDALAGLKRSVQKLERLGTWILPKVEAGSFAFEIVDARHPIIEAFSGSFVANSVRLDGDKTRILLLTGPNMAGKSTLMRQTGLCLLLAQCGFYVPAAAMNFRPASGFYSRMGASDRILQGESTFMVEMKESSQILKEADQNSFVLIDEMGRGTSTQDGLSIAQSVLEFLHDETQALVIFATHYHELAEGLPMPRVQNASMEIREWKGELVFLRNLVLKPAESSYGIHVAKMAGLPKKILERAAKLLQDRLRHQDQLSLFAVEKSQEAATEDLSSEEEELLRTMKKMDLEALSPKAAWTFLESWSQRLRG